MFHIIVNKEKILSETLCISAFDRGFTLGHGLFETILSNNGTCPLLEYHWQRLLTSANYINIKLPFNIVDLNQMIHELLSDNHLKSCKAAIRLTVTDGISERGLLSNLKQKPTFILTTSALPENSNTSMSATIVETRRNENSLSSKIKHISYMDNILAKMEAVKKGFDEAFLLNSKSYLAEGSISNIFIVKNGKIYTPPLRDGALPGVIRRVILNELSNKFKIIEHSIDLNFLINSDEIFISNALLGVKPISKLDDKIFNSSFSKAQEISDLLRRSFNYI